jgi:hypothetical protein
MRLVGAAARCFMQLGALPVLVGGPGHQRDTGSVIEAARLPEQLREGGGIHRPESRRHMFRSATRVLYRTRVALASRDGT